MISIDSDIHLEAKEKRFNISSICEQALLKSLKRDINIDEELRECYKCGKKADTWDGYSEMWICDGCNGSQIKKVNIMAKI